MVKAFWQQVSHSLREFDGCIGTAIEKAVIERERAELLGNGVDDGLLAIAQIGAPKS